MYACMYNSLLKESIQGIVFTFRVFARRLKEVVKRITFSYFVVSEMSNLPARLLRLDARLTYVTVSRFSILP